MKKSLAAWLLGIGFVLISNQVMAERIKDLVSVAGVRSNQLIGYGLVVGLNGSGDKTPFAEQSLTSMLNRFGIKVPAGTKMNAKNVAAVAVNAELPPFAKPGQKVDITVSSLGNAKSLRGGTLLLTPMKGLDGKVYAVAQGNLIVSGLSANGEDGSNVTINIPSVGRVPNGAVVEREVASGFERGNTILLNLNRPDFTTASRMVEEINSTLGEGTSRALDATSVEVLAPRTPTQRVSFLSVLENIEVRPDKAPAKVIVNTRTGTVVINQTVSVDPVAVTHGSLTVAVAGDEPQGAGGGQVNVAQAERRMIKFRGGVSLDEIVNAINQVGGAPSDVVAILEALKEAGALKAELIII